jgi:4-hydroxybenzoate polyprenyltransferase
MAFAAVYGGHSWQPAAAVATVPSLAWWLLFGNAFWVLAYDTEYAMVDRDDDVKIGIRTSALTLGRFDVPAVMAFYSAYLFVWAAMGVQLRYGFAYFAGLAAAGGLALWHYTLIRNRAREGCFKAFSLNHWLGFAVFAGVVIDALLRAG